MAGLTTASSLGLTSRAELGPQLVPRHALLLKMSILKASSPFAAAQTYGGPQVPSKQDTQIIISYSAAQAGMTQAFIANNGCNRRSRCRR